MLLSVTPLISQPVVVQPTNTLRTGRTNIKRETLHGQRLVSECERGGYDGMVRCHASMSALQCFGLDKFLVYWFESDPSKTILVDFRVLSTNGKLHFQPFSSQSGATRLCQGLAEDQQAGFDCNLTFPTPKSKHKLVRFHGLTPIKEW